MNVINDKLKAFGELLDIMDKLREKCPWDKEQTFETLRNLTIEETYELADAITKKDYSEMKKELGDLLLHIVFYARVASEQSLFDIKDVAEGICEKLVFRHPHVFGDTDVRNNPEIVKQNWEELKKKEGVLSALAGVPVSLPAMIKANRIQEKARAVGFDWDKRSQVWEKVSEEMNELRTEIEKQDKTRTENEFGDLFFALINAARLYGVDPENALEKTNRKFIKRFKYLEKKANEKNKQLKQMSLDEMNEIWEDAKKECENG